MAYVVGNGKATGHEYLYAYDKITGRFLENHTDNSPDSVSLPPKLKEQGSDAKNALVLHHNHPNGSSLSVQDLRVLAHYPGVKVIVVHDHDGNCYRATIRERGNLEVALAVADHEAARWIKGVQTLRPALRVDTCWLVSHLICRALMVAGVIEYEFPVKAEARTNYDFTYVEFDAFIVVALEAIRKEWRRS